MKQRCSLVANYSSMVFLKRIVFLDTVYQVVVVFSVVHSEHDTF